MTHELDFLNTLPIGSWKYPRIGVFIPIERTLSYAEQVFYNFLYIAAQGPAFVEVKYVRTDVARNSAAIATLNSHLTHVLMLDSDHVHPTNIIQMFAKWAIIRPDARVISGLNFRRKEPFDPTMGNLDVRNEERELITEWPAGLAEYSTIGAASLFIHRSVFEEMEPPWFYNIYEKPWENNYPGEDVGFSRNCQKLGIKTYVDTGITSPHCADTLVTEETYRAFLRESGKVRVDERLAEPAKQTSE